MAMRGAQTPPGEPVAALGQRDEPGLATTKVDHPACGAPPPTERQSSASTDELAVVEPRQRAAKAAEHAGQQADAQPTPMDTTPAAGAAPGAAYSGAAAAADRASAPPAAVAAKAVLPLQDGPLRVTIDSKERLRWSPQLHQRFCQAVADLGGSPFAKPKDIVTKMNVPGLTLAHVKSHLQKYRQQEGVTFVPHSTRNPPGAGGRRPPQAQQATPAAQQASRPASVANSSDSDGAPSAKRARAAASTAVSGGEPPIALWAEPVPVPSVVVAPVPAPTALPLTASAPHPAAAPPPAEPFQHYLQALTTSTALPPPMPKPEPAVAPLPVPVAVPPLPVAPAAAPPLPLPLPPAVEADEQAGALDKLHALAELACAQHEELAAERSALQEQAVGLAPVEEQLAALPQQPGWPSAWPEVHVRLDALARQQAALRSAVQQHLQRGMALQEELRGFQHAAQELAAHPLLAQAPLHTASQPATPPLGMVAAATAALRAAAEQHGADPNLASQLLAVMTAAAAAGGGSLAPQVAPPIAPAAAAGLAQLQQLYQNAAMLAARQAV